jgi:DNA processing protein
MFSVTDLLVLSRIPNIGTRRLRALVDAFGTPTAARNATPSELVRVDGFSRRLATEVAHFLRSDSARDADRFAAEQLSRLNRSGGTILTFWDPGFPDLLKRIYDPPAYLYVRGDCGSDDACRIAIVGTRSPTAYGVLMTERLCREFVQLNVTVVSGLARGIDTAAHSAVVKNGGRTVAVIGSGLDVMYPPENRALAGRIAARGAVVSEYDMGAKPDAMNFPRRNRIISGLSLGTIVVETDTEGGAMITAHAALDQNREVFAVPGPATSRGSRGCHALIKEGKAKLVEDVADIVAELAPELRPSLPASPPVSEPGMNLFERKMYDGITGSPAHIDALAGQAGLSVGDALVTLLSLECKGLIRQLPGKLFVRV